MTAPHERMTGASARGGVQVHRARRAKRTAACPGACAAAVLLATLAGAAAAATPIPTTGSISVGATVAAGCQLVVSPGQNGLVSFGVLDFGTHPPTRTGTVSTMAGGGAAQVQIQCTPGTTLKIVANAGQNAVSAQRHLALGGARVPYTLTLLSGSNPALAPNAEVTLPMGVSPRPLPVQGTVTFPGSGLVPGVYTDTVLVTVSW